MQLLLQKTLRFAIPAAMLYVLLYLACWASQWCKIDMPVSYTVVSSSLLFFVLGGLYYFLPLRSWANGVYFRRVGDNLLTRLRAPFKGDVDFPPNLTWHQASIVFYQYVDSKDAGSLALQMQRALWNGVWWTTAADLRAVSTIGVVGFSAMMLLANLIGDSGFDNAKATYVFLVLVVLFLVSISFSEWMTRRHMRIGTRQVEIIVFGHRDDLKKKLIDAAKTI